MTTSELQDIRTYVRSKIENIYDPAVVFGEKQGLRDSLNSPHKGAYITVVLANEQEIREGFLQDAHNVLASVDQVISTLFHKLKDEGVSLSAFKSSTVYITLVEQVVYMPNPMSWDENKDGLFLQWGQKYKGMYLPHQIQKMNVSKIAILDRLCCWETGLAANLWRSECGLVFKLVCQSIS